MWSGSRHHFADDPEEKSRPVALDVQPVTPRARPAAVTLSRNDSARGVFYRRLYSSMDKLGANTVVAGKFAWVTYYMLTWPKFLPTGGDSIRSTATH